MTDRHVRTPEELDQIAGEVLSTLPSADDAVVLALSGELGAGKTTFVQALARRLGVHEHVVSPTFMIMRVYRTADTRFTTLVHIDAYRVEDPAELEVLRIPEHFSTPHTLVCIEWPERVGALVPGSALPIAFELQDDGTRIVRYTG